MNNEPLLTPEDVSRWSQVQRASKAWSRTEEHKKRVAKSRDAILRMHSDYPDAYVSWSAGKDSTALAHLVMSTVGTVRSLSIKDDLDFPGEEEYLLRYATEWDIELDLVRIEGLQQWAQGNLSYCKLGQDIHSRSSGLSRPFYDAIAEYDRRYGSKAKYLGLRTEESKWRRDNRVRRGLTYTKVSGEVICQPLADWKGIDVYAYLFSRGIEVLPLYQCVRLHKSAFDVRKAWWLPGSAATRGQGVWLRTYFPSLWRRLNEVIPGSSVVG